MPARWDAPFRAHSQSHRAEDSLRQRLNALWGFVNAVIGYLLVMHAGVFDLRATTHILAFGLGALLISLVAARQFGQFHGGNAPGHS